MREGLDSIPEGGLIAGRYRIDRALARGGMGSVWIAHDTRLDRSVAVKLMDPGLAAHAEHCARFEREAKAVARLTSPHIVAVHDWGIAEGGAPYIVMELLEGESLLSLFAREKRLSVEQTARLLQPVCKALQVAHDASVIHRDLKPANIFLAQQGDEQIVKVLDFGVAKAAVATADEAVTKPGDVLGTPHYMSPEQVRAPGEVDARSDLWSVGILAYRAMRGKLPYVGETMEILVNICTVAPEPPSRSTPHLGPEVDRFFERALARDPSDRFQTATDLAAALASLALAEKGEDSVRSSQRLAQAASTLDDEAATDVLLRGKVALEATQPPARGSETTDREPSSSPRLIDGAPGADPPSVAETFAPSAFAAPLHGGRRRGVFLALGGVLGIGGALFFFAFDSPPEATSVALPAVAAEPSRSATEPSPSKAAEEPVVTPEPLLARSVVAPSASTPTPAAPPSQPQVAAKHDPAQPSSKPQEAKAPKPEASPKKPAGASADPSVDSMFNVLGDAPAP